MTASFASTDAGIGDICSKCNNHCI